MSNNDTESSSHTSRGASPESVRPPSLPGDRAAVVASSVSHFITNPEAAIAASHVSKIPRRTTDLTKPKHIPSNNRMIEATETALSVLYDTVVNPNIPFVEIDDLMEFWKCLDPNGDKAQRDAFMLKHATPLDPVRNNLSSDIFDAIDRGVIGEAAIQAFNIQYKTDWKRTAPRLCFSFNHFSAPSLLNTTLMLGAMSPLFQLVRNTGMDVRLVHPGGVFFRCDDNNAARPLSRSHFQTWRSKFIELMNTTQSNEYTRYIHIIMITGTEVKDEDELNWGSGNHTAVLVMDRVCGQWANCYWLDVQKHITWPNYSPLAITNYIREQGLGEQTPLEVDELLRTCFCPVTSMLDTTDQHAPKMECTYSMYRHLLLAHVVKELNQIAQYPHLRWFQIVDKEWAGVWKCFFARVWFEFSHRFLWPQATSISTQLDRSQTTPIECKGYISIPLAGDNAKNNIVHEISFTVERPALNPAVNLLHITAAMRNSRNSDTMRNGKITVKGMKEFRFNLQTFAWTPVLPESELHSAWFGSGAIKLRTGVYIPVHQLLSLGL